MKKFFGILMVMVLVWVGAVVWGQTVSINGNRVMRGIVGAPSNGQIAAWNSTTKQWEPVANGAGTGANWAAVGTTNASLPGGGTMNNLVVTGAVTAASFSTPSSAAGALVLGDGGSHTARLTTQTMTGDANIILDAAPGGGFLFGTVNGTTNETLTHIGSSGSGNVARVTSPTFVTPTLGAASATTINKVTLTAPATGSTLTIADGKTATVNNSITLAGTDSTTMTFPSASDTVVGTAAAQTLQAKKIQLTFPLGTDDTFEGTFLTLTNTGGVTQWDAVYINSSSQLALADANGSSTYPAVGLVTATVSTGVATSVVLQGIVRNDGWSWTAGGNIYLSTTAGALTQTAPSTTGDKVQVIGKAISATTIRLNPSMDYGTAP